MLSNSTRKLLWFEIIKMLIAVKNVNLWCHFFYKFSAHFRSLFGCTYCAHHVLACIEAVREYAEQGLLLLTERPSVRLSHRSTATTPVGGFAAERPAGTVGDIDR